MAEEGGILVARLTDGVPDDVGERTAEQQARWLLAFTLDWHGRKRKPSGGNISGFAIFPRKIFSMNAPAWPVSRSWSKLVVRPRHPSIATVSRCRIPISEPRTNSGASAADNFGTVVAISHDDRTIDIKKRGDTADFHPEAVFAHKFVRYQEHAESLFRIGEYVADHGMEGEGDHRAARDLLMAIAPRLRGQALQREGEPMLRPPSGSLSIWTIVFFRSRAHRERERLYWRSHDLRTRARRQAVGITANSHKVIRNLLDEVVVAAADGGLPIQCIQKVTDKEDDLPTLHFTTKNEVSLDSLRSTFAVGGGTSFFWARPDARLCVDVLFIDEAAQMSLADVLAVSQAAESIVLLGDPRQLEQPIQGSHPDGVAVSALGSYPRRSRYGSTRSRSFP